jgi:hypothetical protein
MNLARPRRHPILLWTYLDGATAAPLTPVLSPSAGERGKRRPSQRGLSVSLPPSEGVRGREASVAVGNLQMRHLPHSRPFQKPKTKTETMN